MRRVFSKFDERLLAQNDLFKYLNTVVMSQNMHVWILRGIKNVIHFVQDDAYVRALLFPGTLQLLFLISFLGHAIAQAVSRWLPTAVAWV
jgi:hypothetical protein